MHQFAVSGALSKRTKMMSKIGTSTKEDEKLAKLQKKLGKQMRRANKTRKRLETAVAKKRDAANAHNGSVGDATPSRPEDS